MSPRPVPSYTSFPVQIKPLRKTIKVGLTVLKELQRLGCVQFVVGSEKLLISHFSPYEMADDMYRWAKQNYLLNDVQNLQFIAEGEQTIPKQKFYCQPKQILLKVIDVLEKQNKAVKIEIGLDMGVKFLQ